MSFPTVQTLQDVILESVAEGLCVATHDFKIIAYNQKFLQMWRLPKTVADTQDAIVILEFVMNQLKEPVPYLEKTKQNFTQPEIPHFDLLEFKDGRIFERYSHPYRQEGNCIGRVVSFRDVTSQKNAEEALKKTLSLLKATLASTANGILVVDTRGKIVSFNEKFIEMWKIPEWVVAVEDDNRALDFVLNQLTDPEAFVSKVKELYSEPDAESKDTILFKDGRIFERFSRPQRIDGKSIGRVWSFRDITEQQQTQRALERANNELETRVKERTADLSAANVNLKEQIVERKRAEDALRRTLKRLRALSHRILQIQEKDYELISRELHDNIAQSANALRLGLERTERMECSPSEYRQEIHEAVARLTEIVHDVRTISRQWRSDLLGEFGLVAALESYLKDFQKMTGIETEFECLAQEKLKLTPELEIHLYRIAQEALGNVAKHARATRVVLRLKDLGKQRKLSVSDNGVGFLLNQSGDSNKLSKGIGLICMKERADILKGTLEITTGPGNGTKIAVRVPLSK